MQRCVEQVSQQLWGPLAHSLHQGESEGHDDSLLGETVQAHALHNHPVHLLGEVQTNLGKEQTNKRDQSVHEDNAVVV